MERLGILNVYKTNLHQILNLMFKVEIENVSTLFMENFISTNYAYSTRYSGNNIQVPRRKFKITDYAILSLAMSLAH